MTKRKERKKCGDSSFHCRAIAYKKITFLSRSQFYDALQYITAAVYGTEMDGWMDIICIFTTQTAIKNQ